MSGIRRSGRLEGAVRIFRGKAGNRAGYWPCGVWTLLLVPLLAVDAAGQDADLQLGMYVVVSDLDASTTFYEKVFEEEPTFRSEELVAFDVSGVFFALFLETAYEHELVRGNNAVPYVRVDDIDAQFARVRQLQADIIHGEIVDEGVVRLFMFSDPDGNPIEFYSVTGPG